jgi:peptide/nickel transport system permease protein
MAILTRSAALKTTKSRRAFSMTERVSIAMLALIVIVVVVGKLVIEDPDKLYLLEAGSPPSGSHLLGVDAGGHDILGRLLAGGVVALFYPLVIVLLSSAIGVSLGIIAAWCGGWVDSLISSFTNALFAVPGILLVILCQAIFGVDLKVAVVALVISYVPFVTRLVRAQAVREVSLAYAAALRIQGVSGWAACTKHIFPNVRTYATAQATLAYGYAALDLAALSFLGLGVQAPSADWGLMVANGLPGLITGAPHEALSAGIALVVTLIAVNVLSDSISEKSAQ